VEALKGMFFDSWAGLGRVVVTGVLGYAAMVVLLRISGKRTLTKLNAFDLVVTVALGSTLSALLLDKNIALAEGVLAIATLVFLQFAITWASVRARWVSQLVKSEPTLLAYKGEFIDKAMRAQRVTETEALAALRAHQLAGVEDALALVLETDGSLSVLPQRKSA
jgi:uncharacterized membrane protein YcaP (DUF421 family)